MTMLAVDENSRTPSRFLSLNKSSTKPRLKSWPGLAAAAVNEGSMTFSGATPEANLNQPVLRPGMSNTAVMSATSNCGSSLPSRFVYQRPAFALYETNTLKSPPPDGAVMKPMFLFPLFSSRRVQAGGIAFGE